ncbi:hypothetical protein ABT124_50315, partial [Streptomyces sp. NPDC001982]|uniref:hypothetical protein n=1 Tax=Streptomyces sp. NPDC001982 TaxID=3154405 RepID=UPI003325FECE
GTSCCGPCELPGPSIVRTRPEREAPLLHRIKSAAATASATSVSPVLEEGSVVTEPVVVAEDVENDDPYVP